MSDFNWGWIGKVREQPSPPPPPPKQSAVPPPLLPKQKKPSLLPGGTVVVEIIPPQVKEPPPNVGDAIQALGGVLFHLVCLAALVPIILVMVGCLVSMF